MRPAWSFVARPFGRFQIVFSFALCAAAIGACTGAIGTAPPSSTPPSVTSTPEGSDASTDAGQANASADAGTCVADGPAGPLEGRPLIDCPDEDISASPCGLSSLPYAIDFVALCGGRAVFADDVNDLLVLVNPDGGIVRTSPLNGAPRRIALDSETGVIWSTLFGSSQLARMDLDGGVSYVDTPSFPFAIAAGRGKAYALFFDGNGIGELDSASGAFLQTFNYGPGEATARALDLEIVYDAVNNQVFTSDEQEPTDIARVPLVSPLHAADAERQCQAGNGMAVSPDGLHFSTSCGAGDSNGGGSYVTADRDTGNLFLDNGAYAVGPYPTGGAFSPDSRFYATSNLDGIIVFDVQTHVAVWNRPWNCVGATRLAFSLGGKNLVASCISPSAIPGSTGYDPALQVFAFEPPPPPGNGSSAPWADVLGADCTNEPANASRGPIELPDLNAGVALCGGASVVADERNNRLMLVNAAGTTITTAQLAATPQRLAYDRDHAAIWAEMRDAHWLERLGADGVVQKVMLPDLPFDMSVAGGQIFVRIPGAVVQIDGATNHIAATYPLRTFDFNLLFDPVHQQLFTSALLVDSPTVVRRYAVGNGTLTLQEEDGHCTEGTAMAMSPDGAHFSIVCTAGDTITNTGIDDRDPAQLAILKGSYLNGGTFPSGAAFSADSRRFATVTSAGIELYDVASYARIVTWPSPCESLQPLVGVGFSPGGRNLTAFCGGGGFSGFGTPTFQVFAVP